MIVLAVLGLILPGYALARVLRLPGAWGAAFPLSALVLKETVVAFTLLGVPLRFGAVLAVVAVVGLLALGAWHFRASAVDADPGCERDSSGGRVFRDLGLSLAVLVVLGMGVRTTLFPLSGADTLFRWDALARLMLDHEGLSFYPPFKSEHFRTYLYPDGFPPLASTVYWWLYATWGGPCARLTSVAVVLQAVSCLALTYHAARGLFGPTGGAPALAVLSGSSLFVVGLAMGQETGYTALSVAGQLCFALAAVRMPGAAPVVAAGLFAGLGGLAREYGPALSLAGFAVLASARPTRRYLPLFCLVSLAIAGPWYVRNWALTGNPFYPQDLGIRLPVNPVHAGLLATYRKVYGVQTYAPADWLRTAGLIVAGAPLAVLVGVPGLVVAGKKGIGLAVTVGLAVVLWLCSVGYTSGGVEYSLRVLTPAWVALAVAAGAFGPRLARLTGWIGHLARSCAVLAIVACGSYAALTAWAYPAPASAIRESLLYTRGEPLDRFPHYVSLARKLDRSGLLTSGVLIDNFYLATALQRHSRYRPVMVWDPEVAFVFDPRLSPIEVRRRLRARDIGIIAVQTNPSNNAYLFRHRFYGEDRKNWLPAWEVPGLDHVYLLPPRD